MFGKGAVWSVLRRSKEACGIHKLRGRTPFSPSTQRSFTFPTPPVATHYFHAFRSPLLPKVEHVPHMRNFSKMVSAGAQHKQELKLLVNGDTRAQIVVGKWLLHCSTGVLFMVYLGSLTRLTRYGLSMTDWKFTGTLPPFSDGEWLQEFDKYKQSPEYKRVNRDMKIKEFKFIYWMEYGYRMWGRALVVMFALPFSYFLHKRYITFRLGSRLSALFALGAGQGLIGWWVKSGLEEPPSEYSQPRVSPYRVAAHLTSAIAIFCGINWNGLSILIPEPPAPSEYSQPRVSPYRVAAHLTSAIAIFCGLYWNGLSILIPEPPAESPTWVRGAAKLRRLALPISVLVGLTAVSGAFVAGNDAGHAFNTFPKMGDTWIPQINFEMKPLNRNFFENTSTMQLVHCLLETATLISVGILCMSSRKLVLHPEIPDVISICFHLAALQTTMMMINRCLSH